MQNEFKVGDTVVFRNVFALLAGRISQIKGNRIYIQIVDEKFMISTYEIIQDEIVSHVKDFSGPCR